MLIPLRVADSLSKTVRPVLVVSGLGLALLILIPSGLIFDSLEQQQDAYLRSRIAALAARMETLPPSGSRLDLQSTLQREEPLLLRLGLYDRRALTDGSAPQPDESAPSGDESPPHRAVVPYQTPRGTAYAEFELAHGEVETLADQARLAAIFPAAGGVLVFLLAVGAAWAAGRIHTQASEAAERAAALRFDQISAAIAKEVETAALAPPPEAEPSTALAAPQPSPIQKLAAELTLLASSPTPVYTMVEPAALVDSLRPKLEGVELVLAPEPAPASFPTDQALLGEALVRIVAAKAPESEVRLDFLAPSPGTVAVRVTGGAPLAEPGPVPLATARKLLAILNGTLDTALPGGAAEIRLTRR